MEGGGVTGSDSAPLTRMRRVFVIVVDDGVELAVYADLPVTAALDGFLDMAFDRMLEPGVGRLRSAADCVVYDDAMQRLPLHLAAGAIPAPGILYIIPSSATSMADLGLTDEDREASEAGELDLHQLRAVVFHSVRLSESGGPRLAQFLAGPDALFEPDPLPAYDAFISFTTPDFLTASHLMLELTERGLSCFLANTSITAGSLWNDELRLALKGSRQLLLVASSQAAESSWVLSEIGAAWVLDLPIIVVPAGEKPWDPSPLLARDDVRLASFADIPALAELIDGSRSR